MHLNDLSAYLIFLYISISLKCSQLVIMFLLAQHIFLPDQHHKMFKFYYFILFQPSNGLKINCYNWWGEAFTYTEAMKNLWGSNNGGEYVPGNVR
jgi:hypothetical protein